MKSGNELIQAVFAAIDASREEIIAFGRDIWRHPEPGYKEVRTSKAIEEKFRSLGLSPRAGIALTGVRADLDCGAPGPTLAILGEMDSLVIPSHSECDPATGAVHACGHNGILAGMFGAAAGLVRSGVAPELAGRLVFMACPAEECIDISWRKTLIDAGKVEMLGGKQAMIFEGAFDDVDLSFMLHGTTSKPPRGYGASYHNGFVMKRVVFTGKAAHAAGGPQNSRNALSAANLTLNALAFLRERDCCDGHARMHGIITSGGDVVNVIPDRVVLEYQLRNDDMEKIASMSADFDQAARGCASALGCGAEIATFCGYMPTKEDQDIGKVYAGVVNEFFDPDAKVRTDGFSAGSTDMGDVSTILPALHGYCPGFGGTAHGCDFFVADEDVAYVRNAKIAAAMAVRLLCDDAAVARPIAAKKASLMSVEDYKAFVRRIERG